MSLGPSIPTLDGKAHVAQLVRGNVSLVAIVNSQISHEQVKSWTSQIAERWRSHERFRFIHVNLQQNPLRTFLVSFFTSGLKKTIPRHFHQTYILSYDNVDYIREAIGLENKFVGHLYLVDWEGRIRWAGCGSPWNGDNSVSTAGHMLPIPEGGPSGQVAEGIVQGLGET
ncbi:SubName: Full=Related to ATP10-F1F0 ATPase complex assembly protein {ECO:0000313/EMBL:CCA67304.1} [Serendipita indica DSM 11827]|nr:SubName: Full=Related to ATP10-F1F0 ATPase complex assembly protein {ECO:0000313/EMBL:CCA67304.1} [Serendipita indica DSM 11827]